MTEATGVPIPSAERVTAPLTKAVKPGWKTTEFYGAWAAKIVGALLASGILGEGTPAERIAGLIGIVLAQGGYTWSRTMIKTAAPMLLALLMMSNGCGPSAREKAIRGTLITANVAQQAFTTFDRDVQGKLVASATSFAEGEQALKEWRDKRGKAEGILVDLYRAIAVAASFNDDKSLQDMLNTLALVRQQLTAMGVTL